MTILYDFIEVAGGAEQVSIELANSLDLPLIVSSVNNSALEFLPALSSELISLSTTTNIPIWKSIKSIQAFKQINTDLLQSNKILFSGSNAPVAIHNSSANQNIYYCHTPPRFAYDLFDYYQQSLPIWQAVIVNQFAYWVKTQYEPAIRKMDVVLANSQTVQARLKRYLNVESEVIYPPVDSHRFYWSTSQDYYLSTARLEDYKRVQLIVDAFKQMPDKKLVMISGGTLLKSLQKQAEAYSNIKIVGWVTQQQLYRFVSDCIATIYLPMYEDFGMSPIESMAAGKPVIGVDEGGVGETVLHTETGYLCPPSPTTEDLIKAVSYLSKNKAESLKSNCQNRATQFHADNFFNRMKEIML